MKKELFNDGWKFFKDENSFALVWSVPENALEVTLPHDAMIEEAADPDSKNGTNTGFRNGGTYTYVKNYYADESMRSRKILLYFEGIYMNATVFLNGQMIAKRPYGYSGFYAELSDYLTYGADNEIRVITKSGAQPNSRWYSGAGIYRDVWLLTSGKTYIRPQGVSVITENADMDIAVLKLTAEIVNESAVAEDLILETEVSGKKNRSFLFLRAGEKRKIEQRIAVQNPRLWSEDSPELYKAEVKLTASDGKILDTGEAVFGIRTLSVDAKRGLLVNGSKVLLRGACIHHDSGLLGAATYYDSVRRQISRLKKAGFNAIRMSHMPMAEAELRACDELGMYVMDELTDMWNRSKSDYDYGLFFDEWWRDDAEAMVRKDKNHPSVILYSIGNEIPEIGTDQGSSLAAEISSYLHELDSIRYTTAGINGVFAAGDRMDEIMAEVMRDTSPDKKEEGKGAGNVNDFMTVLDSKMDKIVCTRPVTERLEKACTALDVAGYNYMTSRYASDKVKYPDRVIVGSETYPPEIANNWKVINENPNVIGDFTWTGWDYLGEAGLGVPGYKPGEGGFGAHFPAQLAYCGDHDITGNRRPASFYREIAFGLRDKPYIAVQDPKHYDETVIKTPWVISDAAHSWTFETSSEGKMTRVEIYARGAEAELLINGKSVGRKQITQPDFGVVGNRAVFEVKYEPGTIESVIYDEKGQETGRDKLATTSEPASISAYMEEDTGELCFIDFSLCDSEGRPIDARCFDIAITIEDMDNFCMMGFGSGDPKPSHNYSEKITDTWYGKALLIGKKQDKEQPVTLELRTGTGIFLKISI